METEVMNELVLDSFRKLTNLGEEGKQPAKSKLIYPQSRDGKGVRHSEQEFKQLFIESFIVSQQTNDLCYSLETPTDKKYSFKGEPEVVAEDEKGGCSGNIDMCIYQAKERLHLIEFKANNIQEHSIQKDLLKLCMECECSKVNKTNYLIHIIYKADKNTLINLNEKYHDIRTPLLAEAKKEIVIYILFVNGVKAVEIAPCYCKLTLDSEDVKCENLVKL